MVFVLIGTIISSSSSLTLVWTTFVIVIIEFHCLSSNILNHDISQHAKTHSSYHFAMVFLQDLLEWFREPYIYFIKNQKAQLKKTTILRDTSFVLCVVQTTMMVLVTLSYTSDVNDSLSITFNRPDILSTLSYL